MYKNKLNKIWNLIDKIKNEINLPIISDFLEWFYEKIEINFNTNISNLKLNKWDVYFVNLWKNIWTELNKNRPCIIYSSFYFNNWLDILIVPLKSYKWKINKNFNILFKKEEYSFLRKDSVVNFFWIRQISKKRIWRKIWFFNKKDLGRIDKKILKILDIKKEN